MGIEFDFKKYNEVLEKKNKTGPFSFTCLDHMSIGSTVHDQRMLDEPQAMKYKLMTP